MAESIMILSLELRYPTLEEARKILKAELERCRSRRVTAIKIIHGGGSIGVGGALRHGIRNL
jgi:DNA-nicking Smr family endonuclease